MNKKMLFIYNPRAGKGTFAAKLSDVVSVFSRCGYRVEVYPTKEHGDAVERAAAVEEGEYGLLVTAGGDGTLNEVITGMKRSGTELPIGYIPVGSTNDFAASLELSQDPAEAASAIMGGTLQMVDLGIFNDRNFVYVAAFGAFTAVSYATDQSLKNAIGHAAYILEGIKSLTEIKAYPLRITSNGMTMEGRYIYGMITNSVSVGGFRNITGKYVELSDGLFEVTMIREPKNLIDFQDIITALITENHVSPLVEKYQSSELCVEAEEEIPWTLDGEFGGDHQKAVIRNDHNSISIYS